MLPAMTGIAVGLLRCNRHSQTKPQCGSGTTHMPSLTCAGQSNRQRRHDTGTCCVGSCRLQLCQTLRHGLKRREFGS
eukprot:118427-Chlamydomonas_euryale.AAC.2